ncbi:hypothetical protein BJX63DRAFT_415962 [Aspergillus granulosus]|uniref:Uncharacterized protein n=1 Tax=Aspergillus granulosus TaxID=176169 RepID=A0ABR4GSU3_9EURO
MDGMNTSVLAGWYTFSNLGPLATTYTPDSRCTASEQMIVGYINPTGGNIYPEFNVQCTTSLSYYANCMPTTTEASTSTPPAFTGSTEEEYEEYLESIPEWTGYGLYYSPGLACPSGWETVGKVARDAEGTLTSSGILSPITPTTVERYTTGIDMYYYGWEDEASVMKSILEPRQTMAVCCPSGMTADTNDACYSVVENYTPTYGCQVWTGENYQYGETTITYLDRTDSVSRTTVVDDFPTSTIYDISTYTTHFDRADRTRYSAMVYAPLITLLHHESDLQGATAAASSDNRTETETPSNSAERLSVTLSVWGSIVPMVGIWTVAAVLGAAMVLPW